MNLVELTEFIVKNLVSDPDSVSVKQIDEEENILIEVIVDAEDLGRVIGKNGSVANSIRTIASASSYANNNKPVKINIDSI